MKYIGHKLVLFIALLFPLCAPAEGNLAVDPFVGIEIDWGKLEKIDGEIYGVDPSIEYRKLAETRLKNVTIMLVWGRIPIYKYESGKDIKVGYEFNSGMLVKKVGGGYSSLGASSGFLSTDYPELSETVITSIYRDYIVRLIKQMGGVNEASRKLFENLNCRDIDGALVSAMQASKIPSCKG